MNKSAFTLIEVVVSIGIFALLSIMGSTLLFNILKGSKKADTVAQVRQEGASIMEAMSSHLRFARQITVCNPQNPQHIEFTAIDSKTIIFDCTTGATNAFVASNSAHMSSSAVVVTGCSFTCSPAPPQTTSVAISLTLAKSGATVSEDTATIKLDSQVQLRNR